MTWAILSAGATWAATICAAGLIGRRVAIHEAIQHHRKLARRTYERGYRDGQVAAVTTLRERRVVG